MGFNMDFDTDFDALVLDAIKDHSAENPQNLIGIISYVQCLKGLIMTHKELEGALQRLIDEGSIAEIDTHHFVDNRESGKPGSFSGYTYADHQSTYAAYDQWLQQQSEEIKVVEQPAKTLCI